MKNLTPEQWAEISSGLKSVAESIRKIAKLTNPDLGKKEPSDNILAEMNTVWLSNNPDIAAEFKRVSDKKDYEILSFKFAGYELWTLQDNGSFRAGGLTTFELSYLLNASTYTIHSVRRLPDGEVFTIGDMVSSGDVASPIAKMEVRMGSLMVSCADDIHSSVSISLLKKVPNRVPLFTTDDGKEVFHGDKAFRVHSNFSIVEVDFGVYGQIHYGQFKYFSTRELSEEYVNWNKEKFSLSEILACSQWFSGNDKTEERIFATDFLKRMAKTKL